MGWSGEDGDGAYLSPSGQTRVLQLLLITVDCRYTEGDQLQLELSGEVRRDLRGPHPRVLSPLAHGGAGSGLCPPGHTADHQGQEHPHHSYHYPGDIPHSQSWVRTNQYFQLKVSPSIETLAR